MKRARLAWVGASLAAAAAVSGPSLAQNNGQSTATSTPTPGVISPDMSHRRTYSGFEREFDNRRLTNTPSRANHLYKNATDIAKCMLGRAGEDAPEYLGGQLAGDPDYQRLSDALTGRHKRCAQINGEATAIAISGALAEQLVVADAPALADRAPTVNEDEARSFFGDLSGAVTLENIAGCLAVYSPGLSYKVISSEPGSSEEESSLSTLYQQTPECRMAAPPQDVPTLYQRAALATALYEWSHRNS